MGGERGDEKGKWKRRERVGEGEGKKGVCTVGLTPSQRKISGYVTVYRPGAAPEFSECGVEILLRAKRPLAGSV